LLLALARDPASDIYARQVKHKVEFYIDLPMEDFDLPNVEPLDQIVEVGYRFTLRSSRSRTPCYAFRILLKPALRSNPPCSINSRTGLGSMNRGSRW